VRLNLGTLALAGVAFAVVTLVVFRHPWAQTWSPWHAVGLAIFVPSFTLFVVARLQLGGAFSVRAKASTLVTTGIYSRIRNPIYVFGSLTSTGILIFAHRPWWLLIWVILIPIQLLRVRKEEQVLEATFGDAYREYKRKSWF
jgi:protein-S-isoprenylcysteine O-methyltransferase Ste14